MTLAYCAVTMPSAFAVSTGITGRTLRDGGAGCGSCHSMSKTLGVQIIGSAEMNPGDSNSFAVFISDGTAGAAMGVDIAARRNSDSSASDSLSESSTHLKKVGNEITHNGDNDVTGPTDRELGRVDPSADLDELAEDLGWHRVAACVNGDERHDVVHPAGLDVVGVESHSR